MNNDYLSPQTLDRFTWRYARDKRPESREWRQRMQEQIRQFGGTQSGRSNKTERESATLAAIKEYEDARRHNGD